jgi:hypothetical protein
MDNILRRNNVAPAPKRNQTTTWKEFIRRHLDVLAGTDFFTVEVLTWRSLVTYSPSTWQPSTQHACVYREVTTEGSESMFGYAHLLFSDQEQRLVHHDRIVRRKCFPKFGNGWLVRELRVEQRAELRVLIMQCVSTLIQESPGCRVIPAKLTRRLSR